MQRDITSDYLIVKLHLPEPPRVARHKRAVNSRSLTRMRMMLMHVIHGWEHATRDDSRGINCVVVVVVVVTCYIELVDSRTV